MPTTTFPHTQHPDSDDEATTPPAPPALNSCTDVSSLLQRLAYLNKAETTITTRLDHLLNTQSSLTHTLSRLDLIRAHLGSQVVSARTLAHSTLSTAAQTATRVSTSVHRLDTEQSRVRATLAVVEQVAELKACVLGVTDSMGAPQDWETAASYLHRASKIPPDIINGAFAESMVPSAEVPDMPSTTLENAAESLCALFLREFEKAAKEADGEKVTRFFKLFPLVGRAQTGLEVYGKYVCGGVAAKARRELDQPDRGDFFYSTAMTRLFEHIATIVEQHGGLVERHYGEGKMVKVVERLQVEADTQGGIIVDMFGEDKRIERKLTEVKSYAFSFLVQSFMTGPRGTQRTNSPAPGTTAQPEDDSIDVKEIDLLLTEIGVMLGRWSLYCRFLARKFPPPSATPTSPLTLPAIITDSTLLPKIQNQLTIPFTTFTTFFLRRSLEKAFQLDEPPTSLSLHTPPTHQPPYITSSVDDVMYIISKLLTRTLETSQPALTCNIISTISRVLNSDFIGMIQRKMRDESNPRGNPPPDDKIIQFCVLINNLDIACEYNARIIATASAELSDLFPFGDDARRVAGALKACENALAAKAGELIGDAVNILFNQVIKPRLRPMLADAWRDVEYIGVSDEDPEAADVVRERFTTGWDALMVGLRRILTEKTWTRVVGVTAGYFAKRLESRIWGWSGRCDELGAIRLERDVQGVVGVVVRTGRYGVREYFKRPLEICMYANMEEGEEEGEEEEEEGGLTREERRRAREMVVR